MLAGCKQSAAQTVGPDTLYRQCENLSIHTTGKDELTLFDKNGQKITHHDGASISFETSPSQIPGASSCDVALTVKQDGKYGYVLPDGTLFADRFFEDTTGLLNHVTFFKENDKWGLINSDGVIITPPTYENVRLLRGGDWFLVKHAGDTFLIDETGKHFPVEAEESYFLEYGQKLPPRDTYLTCLPTNKRYSIEGKWGLRNSEGRRLLPPHHRAIACLRNETIWVPDEALRQWCQITETGEPISGKPCRAEVYPGQMSHSAPEQLIDDPFENSILWNQIWLNYGEGHAEMPPRLMPDGIRGRKSLLAIPPPETR